MFDEKPRVQKIFWNYLFKATVSREILSPFFFNRQRLVSIGMPIKDFLFYPIFVELFTFCSPAKLVYEQICWCRHLQNCLIPVFGLQREIGRFDISA